MKWSILQRGKGHENKEAFYAFFHVFFYVRYIGNFETIWAEAFDWYLLSGWIAFFAMLLPAVTSNTWIQRRLGKSWKPVQRMSYAVEVWKFERVT